jgi:DNA-binding NarL/FixJ family response regulator
MEPIRVLIADDHPVFRFGLRAILMAEPITELVGEASAGEEAIALATATKPDVVLMDLNMPGIGGLEATRRILAVCPDAGILVLTMLEDDDSVFAAMRAGARGYLLKGTGGEEIIRAIRAVTAGEAIFGPPIAQRLLRHFASPPTSDPSATRSPFPELTEREHDVLSLLAAGYTNTAIADRLFLSQKTVRNHVSNVFAKLQVTDRGQAIVRAREAGLGKA